MTSLHRGAAEMERARLCQIDGLEAEARQRWMHSISLLLDDEIRSMASELSRSLINECFTKALTSINPRTTRLSHKFVDWRGRSREVIMWRCPVQGPNHARMRCIYSFENQSEFDCDVLDFAEYAQRQDTDLLVGQVSMTSDPGDNISDAAQALDIYLDSFSENLSFNAPAAVEIPTYCIDAKRENSRMARAASANRRISGVVCDGWLWDIAARAANRPERLSDIIAAFSPTIATSSLQLRVLIAPGREGWLDPAFVAEAIDHLRTAGARLDFFPHADSFVQRIFDWMTWKLQ